MRRLAKIFALSFAVAIAISGPVLAEDAKAKPFADAKEVNLLDILPPPPAQDSARTKAELGEILTIQVTRTPEMEARAIADANEDI